VKVLSPEITLVALGQWFHILEVNIRTHAKGESVSDVPGSESVAGKRTVYIGTWENRSVPTGSFQEAEEATRKYGVSVVGPVCVRTRTGRLTHSRGVGRVMPVESQNSGHSKGSALIRKSEVRYRPITELEDTMETTQRFISEIVHMAIEESISEESRLVGRNPQVRFCEGHAFPYTKFFKTLNLLN